MTVPAHFLAIGLTSLLPLAARAQVGGAGQPAAAQAPQDTQDPQDPQDAVARSNELRRLGFAAERSGQHEQAAEAFLELCKLEAQNADWVVHAADNLGKVGRFNDAMELCEDARGKFPDVPDLDVTLARIYHLKADTMRAEGIHDTNVLFYYQDTARVADGVLKVHPKHLEARLLSASARFQLGEIDAAAVLAQQAAEDHPAEYGGHAMVGRIALHRFVEAQQRLNRDQPTGQERAALTQEIYQLRQAATAAFEAARAADAQRSFPLCKLGDIAAWSGRTGPALEHYQAALAMDPTCAVDHEWLRRSVEADNLQALYESALTGYRGRDGATPTGIATLVWFAARTHFDRRNWQAARKLFAATLTALPDQHDTLYYLMQSAYWDGAADEAATIAKRFARIAPRRFADMIRDDEQTVAVIKGLARTSYDAKDFERSRDLNHVLAYARRTADEWNNYAFLCRETEAYPESFAAYQEALLLEPESPQLLNDAAVILQYHLPTKENLETARDYYRRAIAAAKQLVEEGDPDPAARKRATTAWVDASNNLKALDEKKE